MHEYDFFVVEIDALARKDAGYLQKDGSKGLLTSISIHVPTTT